MKRRLIIGGLALAAMGCEANVDLLPRVGLSDDADGGALNGGRDDAGEPDPLPPEGGLADSGPSGWATPSAALASFDDVRTGDACGLDGAAGEPTATGCDRRTVVCLGGLAYPTYTTTAACGAADDLSGRQCARLAATPCCIERWACDVDQPDRPSEAITQICAPGCSNLAPDPEQVKYLGCPRADPSMLHPPPWPPAARAPCDGTFFCDSVGQALGSTFENSFGFMGSLYWCENNVIQRARLLGDRDAGL